MNSGLKALAIGVFALAATTVWLRLSIVRQSYEIDQTQKMIRNTRQDIEKMQYRVSQLKSPRHLDPLARKQLGLARPRPEQLILLSESQ